jgi:hypothetical protein
VGLDPDTGYIEASRFEEKMYDPQWTSKWIRRALLLGALALIVAVGTPLVTAVLDEGPAPQIDPVTVSACDATFLEDTGDCVPLDPDADGVTVTPDTVLNVAGQVCNLTAEPVTLRAHVTWDRVDGERSAAAIDVDVTYDPRNCEEYDVVWEMPDAVNVDAQSEIASQDSPQLRWKINGVFIPLDGDVERFNPVRWTSVEAFTVQPSTPTVEGETE